MENLNVKTESDDSNLDIREIVEKYLSYWKWFLLGVVISVIFAYLSLSFKRPSYEANAAIKIKNEQSGDQTTLSAFQDLGILGPVNQNVEDEMEILSSKDLVEEVIRSLGLNVQQFVNKSKVSNFLDENLSMSTEFYKTELYKNEVLKLNFLLTDSIVENVNSSFTIRITSSNNFIYKDLETEKEIRSSFGERFTSVFGDLIITPNVDIVQNKLIGSSVLIKLRPIKIMSLGYAGRLAIEPRGQFSSVLSVKMIDATKTKAEDFIYELVKKYNQRAIRLKEELSKSTSDFVTKRLEIISAELNQVDLTAETIKTRYRISDVASQTGLNMQSGQEIENRIVETSAELEKIGYIKDYIKTKNANDLIPVDLGVGDNNVASTMDQYNQLILQKKRLLENSTEKNPIVVNLNEQIRTLRSNIDQGLNNFESSKQISLDALNKQDVLINSRLYSAPKQERQYRDVQRQQQIKEALYLYLLEKREETALTLGVADPNAKIIDSPISNPNAVAPRKMLTLAGYMIMGFLIPFAIIFLMDLLDTKIRTREDVEKMLDLPIIAEIPKLDSKSKYLVKNNDYSSTAEAFRILRTNLNFILSDSSGQQGKTLFVTSTIAGEGKSFVSSNLAAVLAHAGHRTLLLGMDIRAPKIKQYLGLRGKIGVTNYIIDKNINPKDLIIDVPSVENLNIISSGDIAPNPSELLMKPRVNELFEYCKNNFDFIIVDTAAYSMVTDTLILGKFADAFIYMMRANYLDKRALKYIKSVAKEKKLNNMVLLINGVDFKKGYGYGYGYGYGHNFNKSQKKTWWKPKLS